MQANKKRKVQVAVKTTGAQQLKITSFFQPLGDKNNFNENKTVKALEEKTNVSLPLKNVNACVTKSFQSAIGCPIKTEFKYENQKNFEKRCPNYKIIPDTPFVVDAFNYGTIPGILFYFLSHFHSDHYIGLNGKFRHALYCNKITANLVKLKLRVKGELINVMPMDKPCIIHGIEITLIDANHCPGSTMFVFRYSNGKTLLHTGDFRANSDMENHPLLSKTRINTLYLDTTYCNDMYYFPDQQLVLDNLVEKAKKHLQYDSKTLFVCGTYTIGKEKVFISIAKALNLKVWTNNDKLKVLNCLEDIELTSILTNNEFLANIHVLPLGQVNFEFLNQYLQKFKYTFNQIVGLKPSGWEFSGKNSSSEFKIRKSGKILIYGIPYSEHSSYTELEKFVEFLQPDHIVPTVNTTGKAGQTTRTILLRWSKKCHNSQKSLDTWARTLT